MVLAHSLIRDQFAGDEAGRIYSELVLFRIDHRIDVIKVGANSDSLAEHADNCHYYDQIIFDEPVNSALPIIIVVGTVDHILLLHSHLMY